MDPRALVRIGLCSLLAGACGDDGGGEGSQSASSPTLNPSIATNDPPATDPGPTTGGTGTLSQDGSGESGETSVDPTVTQGATSEDSEPGDTGSVSDPDPDTGSASDPDTGGTTDPPEVCGAPVDQPPCDQGTDDIFKAIGLNCSGDPTTAIPISNPVLDSPDDRAYRVTTHFGSAMDPMDPSKYMWGPREGERLLAINTGRFPELAPDGGILENDVSGMFTGEDSQPNGNPDGLLDAPGIMTYEPGSNGGAGGTPFNNCDGVGDCSDTIGPQWTVFPMNVANDVFYMSFDLQVPAGTHGYEFDFAFFSEEYPNYVGKIVNDMFVVWSNSESFTGNITFIDGQPLTVTALAPYMAVQPGSFLLTATGFPNDAEGAGTGWFKAKGSAVPGETFTIAIAIFDMADDIFDTVGLLDGFRWDCTGCVPTESDSCGIRPG